MNCQLDQMSVFWINGWKLKLWFVCFLRSPSIKSTNYLKIKIFVRCSPKWKFFLKIHVTTPLVSVPCHCAGVPNAVSVSHRQLRRAARTDRTQSAFLPPANKPSALTSKSQEEKKKISIPTWDVASAPSRSGLTDLLACHSKLTSLFRWNGSAPAPFAVLARLAYKTDMTVGTFPCRLCKAAGAETAVANDFSATPWHGF